MVHDMVYVGGMVYGENIVCGIWYKVPLRDVGGMKSGGVSKETHVKPLHLFF